VWVETGCDWEELELEGAPLEPDTTAGLVAGGGGGAATGAGAGAGGGGATGGGAAAEPAPPAEAPEALALAGLAFGLTWIVRWITCVRTFGFGFCVRAASVCVVVVLPLLELSA
jgi:hypothetical protein